MNNALLGLIVFIAALIAGRWINEKALRKLDAEQAGQLVKGLARYRMISLAGVIFFVGAYFVFRSTAGLDGSSAFAIFAIVLVLYLLAGTAFVFYKLKKMKISEEYISSFLLSHRCSICRVDHILRTRGVASMTSRIGQFTKLIRSTKREKRLGTVIFFVTSRCNAACETCFYHEELNKKGDLTFDQIKRVSETMPAITDLWLSGGEPTLRKDVNDIVSLFSQNNWIRRLIVPTNGLIKERVAGLVDTSLSDNRGIEELYLNIALDGYGETHDRIRGVPGNWEKTLECIEFLYPLKEKFGDRFRLNVNTVICASNYSEIEKLSEYLWLDFRLDGQYFNIIRGETKAGDGIKEVPTGSLPGIYRQAADITGRYANRMFEKDDLAKKFVKKVAYVGTIMTHYRHQHSNFEKPTPWSFPCTAGETVAVIDYNGDVRACELLDKFASLGDFEYDFSKLWDDKSRESELAVIDGGKSCWCTHVCFIHSSLQHSRSGLLKDVPRNYLTRRNWV